MKNNAPIFNLELNNFKKYYLTHKDKKNCEKLLDQFKSFMSYFHQCLFLGYIDLLDDSIDLDKDSFVLVISEHAYYKDCRYLNRCKFVILWDDKTWGKLEAFNVMYENGIFDCKFNKENFRKLISKQRGCSKSEAKEIGQYFLRRMVPHLGIQNKVPMLFRKEENFSQGMIYGHPSGYARDIVLYDFAFRKKFYSVLNRLSNETSKKVFKLLIYGRPSDIWQYYFNNFSNMPQYLSYVSLDKKSIVLNCGVEAGFEIPAFLAMDCEKIYCVDPFGDTKLCDYARTWANEFTNRLIFIKKWLYEKPQEVLEKENTVTTLQNIVEDQNISQLDLIKSDIEGAERYMVDDLIVLVEKYRPQLAISIYHTQFANSTLSPISDMVDIPLKLINNIKDYNFYINFYSYERWEAVLYCIPKERVKA